MMERLNILLLSEQEVLKSPEALYHPTLIV
jgi:hypothetical protein